jgi:hypothetical protein
MTQHQTTVQVKNPSGDALLRISMQGSLPQKTQKYHDYVNDSPVGSMRPNGLGSIGGGQFDWKRRFVFIADAPTVLEVTARDSNFIVEELERVDYADTGVTYEAKTPALSPARVGAKYQLDADTRISIRIDQKDESLDGAYVNLRQIGNANIRIVQQEEREMWKVSRVAAWTAPTPAGEVAPGTSRSFTINDSSRLIVATDSEKEITLQFSNHNILHSLRLLNADADGKETMVANIGHGQSQAANTGANTIWTPGLNLQSGQVIISKGVMAIVQQSPQ